MAEVEAQARSLPAYMFGPELPHRLKLQPFEAIARQAVHLAGLAEQETREYVLHGMKVAGATRPIFSDEALSLIYHHAEGIPGRISSLCAPSLIGH